MARNQKQLQEVNKIVLHTILVPLWKRFRNRGLSEWHACLVNAGSRLVLSCRVFKGKKKKVVPRAARHILRFTQIRNTLFWCFSKVRENKPFLEPFLTLVIIWIVVWPRPFLKSGSVKQILQRSRKTKRE